MHQQRNRALIVHDGRFYFHMRVPEDVVGAFEHKFRRKTGTIRVSLETKDRRRMLREMGKKLSFYIHPDMLGRTTCA